MNHTRDVRFWLHALDCFPRFGLIRRSNIEVHGTGENIAIVCKEGNEGDFGRVLALEPTQQKTWILFQGVDSLVDESRVLLAASNRIKGSVDVDCGGVSLLALDAIVGGVHFSVVLAIEINCAICVVIKEGGCFINTSQS